MPNIKFKKDWVYIMPSREWRDTDNSKWVYHPAQKINVKIGDVIAEIDTCQIMRTPDAAKNNTQETSNVSSFNASLMETTEDEPNMSYTRQQRDSDPAIAE